MPHIPRSETKFLESSEVVLRTCSMHSGWGVGVGALRSSKVGGRWKSAEDVGARADEGMVRKQTGSTV